MKENKKAFTLIELMVAMGIVALLVGMSLYGISLVQRSSRDSQRREMVRSVSLALEDHYASSGSYPTTLTASTTGITVGAELVKLPGNSATPAGQNQDSDNDKSAYCYSVSTRGTTYKVGIQLENGDWFELGDDSMTCDSQNLFISGTP